MTGPECCCRLGSPKERLCYTAVMVADGFSLGIVKEGEREYYRTDHPTVPTYEEAMEWAAMLNEGMGVGKREALEIVARSMRPDAET